MNFSKFKALQEYQGVGMSGVVEDASPAEVIRLLLDGFLNKVSAAEGHIRLGDVSAKAKTISKALAILDALRCSLDLEQGGELAQRMDALYEYVSMRLFEANVSSDLTLLEESRRLIGEIREAWVQAHVSEVSSTSVTSHAA